MEGNVFFQASGVNLSYKNGLVITRAVRNVSFSMPKRGQALAVVGESGCGKTSLSRALQRLLPDNVSELSGSVLLEGEDIFRLPQSEFRKNIRWKKIAWVPQDVAGAFNPIRKIGSHIKVPLLLGKRSATDEEVIRLLVSVGLSAHDANQYPFELSGGMRQRALIAMALALNPCLIILDEPTSALDVSRQGQVVELLEQLKQQFSTSYILITHNIGVAAVFCDLFAVMYAGRIVERGTTAEVVKNPLHPYTQKLLKCVPTLESESVPFILGEPPDLSKDTGGCPFRMRPAVACASCGDLEPELRHVGGNHFVACHGACM